MGHHDLCELQKMYQLMQTLSLLVLGIRKIIKFEFSDMMMMEGIMLSFPPFRS